MSQFKEAFFQSDRVFMRIQQPADARVQMCKLIPRPLLHLLECRRFIHALPASEDRNQ